MESEEQGKCYLFNGTKISMLAYITFIGGNRFQSNHIFRSPEKFVFQQNGISPFSSFARQNRSGIRAALARFSPFSITIFMTTQY